MSKTKSIFMVVGISAILLLAGGTHFSVSVKTANAQAPTLGEPILVQNGNTTSQSQLGPNRTQFTFSTNGTLNGSIEVTNTGSYVTTIGNNFAISEGQGVISTKDGSETASYSLITCCDSVTQDGKVTFRGSFAYSTNSTGDLSVLNNILTFLRGEADINTGNFNTTEWELK